MRRPACRPNSNYSHGPEGLFEPKAAVGAACSKMHFLLKAVIGQIWMNDCSADKRAIRCGATCVSQTSSRLADKHSNRVGAHVYWLQATQIEGH